MFYKLQKIYLIRNYLVQFKKAHIAIKYYYISVCP